MKLKTRPRRNPASHEKTWTYIAFAAGRQNKDDLSISATIYGSGHSAESALLNAKANGANGKALETRLASRRLSEMAESRKSRRVRIVIGSNGRASPADSVSA